MKHNGDPSPDSPASHPTSRGARAVLALARARGGVSRAQLSEETGYSKSTTAQLVADLLNVGLLREERSGSGRSAVLVPVLPRLTIGAVHLEHERITAAVGDTNAAIVSTHHAKESLLASPVDALARAHQLLGAAVASADRGMPDAVVVALPGPVSVAAGRPLSPSVLTAWSDAAPAEFLRAAGWDAPILVDNDANLGAWGERTLGAARDYPDALYLEASHGIGAGLLLGGEVYRGGNGAAGEIGHVQVDATGPLCRCGQNGCLEVVASSTVILQRLATVHDQPAPGNIASYTDPISARLLREAGTILGRAVAQSAAVLNPTAVIIGGEMGRAHESYRLGVREAIERHTQPLVAAGMRVLAGELGTEATIRGALARGVRAALGA